MEEQLILIYNSWIIDMILWTYSTISQSIANIGDSGDFLDFLNGLVEINPKNKETSVNETADQPNFFLHTNTWYCLYLQTCNPHLLPLSHNYSISDFYSISWCPVAQLLWWPSLHCTLMTLISHVRRNSFLVIHRNDRVKITNINYLLSLV